MAKVADSSVAAIAMAIVGRSARACDVCATKGAHWFCAADDAYLCTVCDTQVHSANALSLRHERVRLTSNGTKGDGCKVSGVKKAHPRPAQVAPVRKRSRTARPYSHHLKKLTQVVKAEEPGVVKAELELFDFLDADEFLVADAGNQEVPNLVESSSSDFDLLSSDYEHSASADSFAAFFKGKAAAQSQGEVDQFLVPDKRFESSSQDDAFFFPGDIPGLDSFVPEMDLSSDDFSLSFDLALQNHDTSSGMVETFEGELTAQPQDAVASPFAKWFATKREAEDIDEEPLSPERIKRDAMAMLKCCEGEASIVPSLQLNFQEVLTAWSGRGEPWIVHPVSSPTTSSDAGLVPDLACGGDESQSSGDRDARVLRYKEKRRTRLFSKKIRYEVRKLNAERRPRMKGRFVKRSSLTCTAAAAS